MGNPRLILLAMLVIGAGCREPECTMDTDCPGGKKCVEEECVAPPGRPPPPVDSGQIDTGIVDTGPDGGVVDTGPPPPDSGPMDVGPFDGGPDAGPQDAGGPVGSFFGEIWAAEYQASAGSEYTTFALFEDRDGVTYDVTTAAIQNGEGGSCQLRTERRLAGTPTALETQTITIIPGPTLGAPYVMFPVGNGRYEPMQNPVVRMFGQSGSVTYTLNSSGAVGTLASATQATLPPPTLVDLTPPRATVVDARIGQLFTWVPNAAPGAPAILEMYDVGREVVLRCEVDDDGSFNFQSTLGTRFHAASPTPPLTVEVRYESRGVMSSMVIGDAEALPIDLIAAQGVRYGVSP